MSELAAACWKCGTPGRAGAKFCRSCGARLAGGPGGAAAEPGEQFDPDSRSQRRALRRRVVAVGIVVAVLAGGYVAVDWIQRTWFGPAELVERLFEAIETKDSAAILEMGCGESAEPLCAVGALKKGYTPATGWRVTGVEYGSALKDDQTRRPLKGHASVGVSYEIDGRRYRDSVGVQRDWQGFFRGWSVTQLPGDRLWILSSHLRQVRLAEAKVRAVAERPASRTATEGSVWAIPGTYTLRGAAHALYDDSAQDVLVSGDQGEVEIPVASQVKAKAETEIKRQIRTKLNECAESTDLDPSPLLDPGSVEPTCPFRAEDRTSVRRVRWDIDQYPTVRLELDDAGPVWVKTEKKGKATVTYQVTEDALEPREWRTETQNIAFEVGGQVKVVDGKVRWVRQR